MIRITEDRIDEAAVVQSVASSEAGALVSFTGRVRSHNLDRDVLYLEYEAYPAMALREMDKIRTESLEKWPLQKVGVVHRLGRLEIGEASVVIAVSASHRSEAFEACRWIIDSLKERVPIWKKEHFKGGTVWVEGPASHQPPPSP